MNRRSFVGGVSGGVLGVPVLGNSSAFTTVEMVNSWPQIGFDAANTGHAPDNSGPKANLGVHWSVSSVGEVKSSPAVFNGRVYVQFESSEFEYRLVAIDLDTGEIVWKSEAPFGSWPSPAVTNETVFMCGGQSGSADAGKVVAIDRKDGSENWSVSFESEIRNGLKINEGTLIAGTNRTVYALDAKTGNKNWELQIDGDDTHTPAVGENRVYVATDEGFGESTLFALDASSGTEQWTFTTNGEGSKPAIGDSMIYYSDTDQDILYALNPDDGSVNWTDSGSGAIALADGTIYVNNVGLKALDSTTGERLWHFQKNKGSIWGLPGIADGVVYFGTDVYGKVFAVNASDGTLLSSYQIGDSIRTSPVIVNNMVLVGSFDGNLYCLTETEPSTPQDYETQSGEQDTADRNEKQSGADNNGLKIFEQFEDSQSVPTNIGLGAILGGAGLGAYRLLSSNSDDGE